MSVQSNRNICDHLLGVNFFSNSFPLLAHKVPSHGKTQYMLGTRQVLACLRCQFFGGKEGISRTREERKAGGFLSRSRVSLARPVLAELSRQANAAEHCR